jgi:hypothetical protein
MFIYSVLYVLPQIYEKRIILFTSGKNQVLFFDKICAENTLAGKKKEFVPSQ